MKWKHSSTDPRYEGTYHTWKAMKRRCYVPEARGYANYGGRGIIVCERWKDNFDAFIEDMGVRPAGLTIERQNVHGNYEPGNCVWATQAEQQRNKQKPYQGPKNTIEPWEREFRRQQRDHLKSLKPTYVPPSPVHGSKKMYAKHGCRCEICVTSQRARWRHKLTVNPERHERKKAYLREYHRKPKYDL